MKFDKDYKFETYKDDLENKNVSVIEFDLFNKVNELDKQFESIEDGTRQDYKLNAILPTIMDYKLRGILSIAQQINFTEDNVSNFLEYSNKQKSVPTLENYRKSIMEYCVSDKLKIKVFNAVFPHGLHNASQNKDIKDIKGVDRIYLQKIGFTFDKVLDSICKGKDEQVIIEFVKTIVTDRYTSQLSSKSAKNQFIANTSKIDINEIIECLQHEETEEQKLHKKELIKTIKTYNKEIQDWICDVSNETILSKKLIGVINDGLIYNQLDKKCLLGYYKSYIEMLQKAKTLINEKVVSNKDMIEFSRKAINVFNDIFGDGKGILCLQEIKANIRSLLSKKDVKLFDNGEELSEESINKLFEPRSELSKTKSLQKIINSKNLPSNVKTALAIHITNEFYETVEKESYNKNWQKRTFYVKF